MYPIRIRIISPRVTLELLPPQDLPEKTASKKQVVTVKSTSVPPAPPAAQNQLSPT